MNASFTADALIAKAEECYSLGLITESTLETVTQRALREPGYTAILELPYTYQIDDARSLAAAARRRAHRSKLRRIFHV